MTSFSKGIVCQRIDWSTVRLYKKTSTCVHRISHAHLGKNAQMPWQKQSRQHCELRARRIRYCQRKGTYCLLPTERNLHAIVHLLIEIPSTDWMLSVLSRITESVTFLQTNSVSKCHDQHPRPSQPRPSQQTRKSVSRLSKPT